MSSKKDRRRKRQEQEKAQAQARGGRNPATMFIVGIAVILLLTVVGAMVLRARSGPDQPPWSGAVWSPEHGHWH
jgi:hypothetical protein